MHAKYARLIPRPRASPQVESDVRPEGPNMWHKMTALKAKIPLLLKRVSVRKILPPVLVILVILMATTLVHWLISRAGEKIDDRDFTQGVLAVNTSKSTYTRGETVLFQMASLDPQGDTLCDSDLQLEISVPSTKQPVILTTKGKHIVGSTTCGDNNVTNEPDYITRLPVDRVGTYKVRLTNLSTDKKVASSFVVVEKAPDFQVERSSATRINPFKSDRYPMVITVTAKEAFEGKVVERIPKSFSLIWQGPSVVEEVEDYKTVSWDVSLKAGESRRLAYEYTAPQVSPEFYKLGVMNMRDSSGRNVYQESTSWQIASDFACTSNLSGGTGNWATAGTWSNCNSTTPQTTDSVTITAGDTVTLNASPSITFITINGTLSPDASNRTLTLTNATNTQVTLAYGASGSVNTANASTIVINGNASWTTTAVTSGNVTAYHLSFTPALGGARTYTMGSGTMNIAGNFTSTPTSTADRTLTINLGGTTTVTGTTTLQGTGCTTTDTSAAQTALSTTASNHTFSTGNLVLNANGEICRLTANASTIILTGTTGTLITNPQATSISEGTSTISVRSASGTPNVFSAAETVYILEIDSAATIINAGANITTNNTASNKLYVKNGVFNQEARTITPGTNATIQVDDGGTLCLGGTTASTTADCASGATQTTAQAMPSFTTYTFSSGSTVRYLSDNNTTVSRIGGSSYGNLELKPKFVTTSYAYTLAAGTMSINGNFTINPNESGASTPALTVNLGGATTVASGKTTTITRTNSATASLDVNPGSSYDLSTGFMVIEASGTLDAGSATSTITLTGISGTLFTNSGTFTQGSTTVTVTSASGTPTLLGGTTSTTFSTLTLNSAATVINGGNAFTVSGNLNISQGVFNANAEITGPGSSGTLTISSGATLCLGGGSTNTTATCDSVDTSTSAIGVPGFQNYTMTGSTVRFLSNVDPMPIVGLSYHNLVINPVLTSGVGNISYSNTNLIVNGDFTVRPSGSANTLRVDLHNDSTLSSTSTVYIGSTGSASSVVDIKTGVTDRNMTTGFINIDTGGTLDGGGSAGIITLTGISGTLFSNSGTFTQGSTTVTVTSASGTPTLLGGTSSTTFSTLTLNSAATVVNTGKDLTISGNLNITQGVLNADSQITGPEESGTLTVASGQTLCLGGGTTNTTATCDSVATSTSAVTIPLFSVYTLTGSTVRYLSNAATSVSNTPTYNNLIFNPVLSADRTYTIGGATTINGDLDIIPSGSANTLLVNLGGTTTLGVTKTVYVRRSGSNALANLDAVSGANYALSAGFVSIGTGGTYTARTSTITLTGTSGTLLTNSGTFTQGSSIVTATSASGTPTLLGGTSSTTFATLTLNSAATVINGGNAFTIDNNMNVSQGVFNANAQITGSESGTLTVSSGATLCLGGGATNTTATCDSVATSSSAITMPTFQTYTFTGSTIRYLSNADTAVLNTPTYNNLIFNPILTASHAYTLGGAVTINGDFTSNPTASSSYALTTALGGTTTVAAGKTISLTGTTSGTSTLDTMPGGSAYDLSAGYIDIGTAGTLDAASSTSTITLTGTSATPLFTLAGAFTAGSSTVIFNPDADVNLTSGAFTFYNLSLTPAISTAGRTYTFGSGTQTVNGDFTIQPSGTQLLTVNMAGDITVANTKTTTITRSSTATSKLVPGASNPAFSSGNITVAAGGTLDGTSSSSVITLTANGTPLSVAGTYTPGSTTISYIPASTTGVNVASTTYYNVIFNKASNTFSLQSGGITVTNDLTITAGVLDAVNTSNYPITVGRNWTNTPGTSGFEAQQGTVTFNTTTTGTITGATTFYNFTSTAAGKTIKFNDSTTYRVNGLLTLTGSAGPTYVTLDSVSGNPSWTINHQGTEAVSYTSVKNSACDGTSLDIDAYGANNYNAGGNGDCWLFTEPMPQVDYSFWKFDEGYGTDAHDSSDGTNTGTLAGTTKPTWQNEEYCVVGKCLYFEGTTAKVTTSKEVNTRTVSFWARPISTTTTFLQLTDSIFVSASSGTLSATGFDTPIFYVNGVLRSNVESGKWQHIVVTTATNIDASEVTLGNNSTNFYQGLLDEVRFDATQYTAGQVKGDFVKRGGADPVSAQYGDDMSWISNGLVGYWKMDEGSWAGTTDEVLDTTHTGNDGTAACGGVGCTVLPNTALGKFGNGGSFVFDADNNKSQYIQIPHDSTLNMSSNGISVSAWVKLSTKEGYMSIAGKGSTQNTNNFEYGLWYIAGDDRFEFAISADGTTPQAVLANTAGSPQLNTWYLVTGTYDPSTRKISVTVNNMRDEASTSSSTYYTGTARLAISERGGNENGWWGWEGGIDEVRVYKRVLSPAEIQMLYAFSPSPIAHWKLDEGSGTTANDSSDNAYTGTLTNSPVWGIGKYGGGVTVNGTQQYISVADDANLRLSGNFTLEGWVRPQNTSKDYLLINNNTPLMQKIDGTDGYELGITQDGIPYGMLTNVTKTWTRYDNTGSADCTFSESYDDGCIYDRGATNDWDDVNVYTPFVYKEGSTYKMYYGGNDGTHVRVGLATSTNGYSWTRNSGNNCATMTGDGCVLTIGGSGEWNAGHMYFPNVIKDSGTYKMWMGGSDGVTNVRIGYATSTDGANWSYYGSNNCSGTTGTGCVFNIGTSGDWDEKFVSGPSVIKDGSTYKMWYLGRNAANTERIGYATSSDGTTWTRYAGNNCSGTTGNGCVFDIGGVNTWYSAIVTAPRVIKDGNLYHMLYSAIKTGDDHYRLGYATSTDGITWTKYDDTSSAACGYSESYDEGCILNSGSTNSWDDRYTQYSTFLKDGPTMRIWYSGIRVSGNYRIGYATFTPGITDTTAVSGDTYHHLAFTKSGTSLSLYVDGALKTTGTTAVTTIANTSALLSGNSLYGSLDDLKIYNYARSQGEITRDMNANHPAPGSPVGSALVHYKFDEGYGDSANNSGSNGSTYNGNLAGNCPGGDSTCPTWNNEGKFGKSLSFDGTDEYLDTQIDMDTTITPNGTISWWVKPHDAYNDSAIHGFWGQTTGAVAPEISAQKYSDNKFYIGWNATANDDRITLDASAQNYPQNTWSHYVFTWENNGYSILYHNGVEIGRNSGATTIQSVTGTFLIGKQGGLSTYFDGEMDEFKIYNSALSADQVKVEYSQGKSQVMGALSTASDGTTADNSSSRAYCPPGNIEGNCAAGQNPAPVVHLTFDEGSGTTAYDRTGNAMNGTLDGSPSFTNGKLGGGLELGSGKYVTLTSEDATFSTNNRTVAGWIKRTSDSGFDEFIIDNQDANGDGWFMFVGSLDKLECYYNNAQSLSSDTLAIGRWYHVACTTDGSTQRLYLDGIQVDSDSITGSISESNDARIGARSYTSPASYLNAVVDDFKVYTYTRTAAQIAWDYNRGAPAAWWKFDECDGTAIHSTNEVYNTNLNGTWSGSGGGTQTSLGDCETVDSAWYNGQSGKYGGSLNFDGTDDAVDLGTSYPNLTGWTGFSVTGWFNSTNTTPAGSIVSKFDGADNGYGTSVFNVWHESGELRFKLSVDNSWDGTYIKYPTVSNSTWHHFAGVWDGTNYKIYVDGKFGEQASRTGVMTNPASTNFYIGRRDDATPYWFSGKIDDVRIYNYGLSEQQIKLIYNGGQAVNFR